jgi:hypothetical protein
MHGSIGGHRRPRYRRNPRHYPMNLGPRCYDDVTGELTYMNLTVIQDGLRRAAKHIDWLDDLDHSRPYNR